MHRTFKSGTDRWFLIVVAVVSALLVYGVWTRFIWCAVPLAAADVWLIAALLRTEYMVTGDNVLLVKSGYAPTLKIPVGQIVSVRPIRSFRPAYANSFRRLEIVWKSGYTHKTQVSPADPDGFVSVLRRLNPSIVN